MKRIFGTIFAVFLALVLFFVMLPVMILPALMTGEKKPDIPALAVLEFDLGGTMTDQPHSPSYGRATSRTPSVVRVVEALARAEGDDRVSGLFVRLGTEAELPLAQAEELRDAFRSFREKGKFVIVHAQGFASNNLGTFYAASESDELWMRADGRFASAGVEGGSSVAQAMPANNEAVAKAFAATGLAGARNTARGSIARSIHERATAGIAKSKGMRPDHVRNLLRQSPYIASDAMIAGLVGRLGTDEEARAAAVTRAGAGAEALTLGDYYKGAGTPYGGGSVIAVVYAEGTISAEGVDKGEARSVNANITADAIRGAADDDNVKAILFRIDSAGGSAVASGQIWKAVRYASGSGKPVVVSMGSVAASGGYYVAMAADRIIAQPTTVTGSIGVVDGKFILGGEYGAHGLMVNETMAGVPAKTMDPSPENASGDQWQSVNQVLGNFYTDFTLKVADGRGLSLEAVQEVASGRPWSGVQAMELGLIDDLGGFRFAIGETKAMMGLDASAPVELRTWPGPASRWQRMAQMQDVSGTAAEVILMFSQLGQVETIKDLMGSVYNGVNGAEPVEEPAAVE